MQANDLYKSIVESIRAINSSSHRSERDGPDERTSRALALAISAIQAHPTRLDAMTELMFGARQRGEQPKPEVFFAARFVRDTRIEFELRPIVPTLNNHRLAQFLRIEGEADDVREWRFDLELVRCAAQHGAHSEAYESAYRALLSDKLPMQERMALLNVKQCAALAEMSTSIHARPLSLTRAVKPGMRIAIAFSGHIRECLGLDRLAEFARELGADVFISTYAIAGREDYWRLETEKSDSGDPRITDRVEEFARRFRTVKLRVSDPSPPAPDERFAPPPGAPTDVSLTSVRTMFSRIAEAVQDAADHARANGFEYDVIIRARPDIVDISLPPAVFASVLENECHGTLRPVSKEFSDVFFYGRSGAMLKMAEIASHLKDAQDIAARGHYNAETAFVAFAARQGVRLLLDPGIRVVIRKLVF